MIALFLLGVVAADSPARAPIQVTRVQPGPKDALVAVGDVDGVVRIVDVADGSVRRVLRNAGGRVERLAWSADGARVAAVTYAPGAWTWSVWDVDTGIRQLEDAATTRTDLALDERGDALLTWGHAHGARVQRLDDGTCWELPTTSVVRDARWLPGSTAIVTGENGGTLTVWSASTGLPVASTRWSGKSISCLTVSGDGRHLLAGAHGSYVGAWSLPVLLPLWSKRADPHTWLGDDDSIACIAISPTDDVAFIGTRTWWICEVFRLKDGSVVWSRDFEGGNGSTMHATISPDGRWAATAHVGSTPDRIFEMQTGRTVLGLGSVPIRAGGGSLGWTGDGRYVVLDVVGSGALQRLDGSSLDSLDELRL